jgi:MFS family permease
MTNRLRTGLERSPLLTAVVYTGVGVLPLYLVSSQVLQLDQDISFGVAQLGLATAAFFGSAALAANPGGKLVSDMGPLAGLRVGSAATILSCLVAVTATAWWLIPIATAVGGVGNGIIQVASNVAIFDGVRQDRQGLAFGAKQASVPLASVLAGLSLPVIGLVFGWRWVFAGAVVLATILVLSAPRLGRGGAHSRIEEPLRRPAPSMLWLGLAGITGAAAGNGLSLFIVPSAVDIGLPEAAAGGVLAGCSLAVVGLRISTGWLVDRRRSSGHAEMAWMAGVGAIGALTLMVATGPGLYLVAMPLALLGAWGWPGLIFFTVVNTYPEFPARASGLLLSSNLTGVLVGPLVVGALAGRDNYPGAWLFVSICAAVSTIGFVMSRRTTTMERLAS